MKRYQRVFVNVLSNMLLHGIGMFVAFFMLPLLLRYFGKETFGLYAYVGGIVILFTFVSSAMSMSLMKYVPESLAAQDYRAFNCYVSAALSFTAFVNIPAGILIAAFPHYGAHMLDLPPHMVPLARQVFMVVGMGVALQCFLPVVNGIYFGLEMFALRNGIQLISIIFNVLAYFLVVALSGTLAHYTLIVQLGILSTMFVAIWVLLQKLPCRLMWIRPDWPLFKRTLSMNLFLVANQAAHSLLYSADKIILQKMFGAVSVGEYQVARQTDQMLQSVISLPLAAILPSLSGAFATGDGSYIRRVNGLGSWLYCAVLAPPLVVLFCMYDDFISLWVGDSFGRAIAAGRLFVGAVVVATPLKVFSHSLVANGEVKALGIAKVTYALLNVPLSILCAWYFGFIGVVIPTAAYWVFVHPALLLFLARRHGTSLLIFTNLVLVFSLLPFGWWCRHYLPSGFGASWATFIINGIILYALVLFVYLVLLSFMTPFLRETGSFFVKVRGGR